MKREITNYSICELEDRLRLVNLCVFEEVSTDNIMDFMLKVEKKMHNADQFKAFFKCYWDLMQEETIEYYN